MRPWDGEGARPLGGLSLGRPQETGRFSPSILRVGVFLEEVGLPGEGVPPYPPPQEKEPSTVSRTLPFPPSLASCRCLTYIYSPLRLNTAHVLQAPLDQRGWTSLTLM